MIKKQIPTITGILIIVILAGVIGASVLLLSQEDKEKTLLEEGVEYEEDIISVNDYKKDGLNEGECKDGETANCFTKREGDVVWYDNNGVMWTTTIGNYNLPNAISQCNDLTYAGSSNWGLPTWEQLRNDFGASACGWEATTEWSDLGGQDLCTPSWDINGVASEYWCSSENNSVASWSVFFNNSGVGIYDESSILYVRCRLKN